MTNFNAQEYLEKNLADQSITKISLFPLLGKEEKLTGDLVIQDYPNLAEINFPNHELTSLTIVNCPQLQKINVRDNQLTALELEKVKGEGQNYGANEISEIIASGNELTALNLTNCPKLKKLMVPDNPLLTNLAGLNLANIRNINLTNTLVNLAEDYEELQQEKKELLRLVKTTKEAAEEKELVLTEAIQTSIQAEEAIQRLLKKTEKDWKYDLDNPQQALPSFQLPQTRARIQELLLAIIQAKVSKDYPKLVQEWNGDKEYNAEEDFTGTLGQLMELLRAKSYFKNQESQFLVVA